METEEDRRMSDDAMNDKENGSRVHPATPSSHCSVLAFLRLAWIVLFAIGMAFTEACVVVYIRQIYDALESPVDLDIRAAERFTRIHPWVLTVERYREVSTIVMLIAVAHLAGRSARERWGVYLLSFGVWDIWYYVWLYALIRWPPSLLTTDILFLIPCPWVAPVLLPVLAATPMAVAGGWLVLATGRVP
jgi:hypothetical protein